MKLPAGWRRTGRHEWTNRDLRCAIEASFANRDSYDDIDPPLPAWPNYTDAHVLRWLKAAEEGAKP